MQNEKASVGRPDDDDPKIEFSEIDISELEAIAPYQMHYKSLGFGDATMVMLAPTLVVPLARAEPVPQKPIARAVLMAVAAIALVAGSGCVAFRPDLIGLY